jgi:hypothetical protein
VGNRTTGSPDRARTLPPLQSQRQAAGRIDGTNADDSDQVSVDAQRVRGLPLCQATAQQPLKRTSTDEMDELGQHGPGVRGQLHRLS